MRIKFLLAISLLFVGCTGTGRFTALKANEAVAPAPKTFTIKEIYKKEGVSDSMNASISKELESQFKDALVRENLTAVGSQPDLSISIQIEEVSPGNEFVRYILGPIFGGGRVTVLIKTMDKDGKDWLSGEGEGTVTQGSWGGNIESTCERIAVAYEKEFRKRNTSAAKSAGG